MGWKDHYKVTRGTHWTWLKYHFPVSNSYPSVFHNYTAAEFEV